MIYGLGEPMGKALLKSGCILVGPDYRNNPIFTAQARTWFCSARTTVRLAKKQGAKFTPCQGEHGDASCIVPDAAVAFFKEH